MGLCNSAGVYSPAMMPLHTSNTLLHLLQLAASCFRCNASSTVNMGRACRMRRFSMRATHVRPGKRGPEVVLPAREDVLLRPLPGAGTELRLSDGSSTLSMMCTTELQTVVLLSTLAVSLRDCPDTCTCTGD